MIDATSSFLSTSSLFLAKALMILPRIGKIPWESLSRLLRALPAAESPSTMNSSLCFLPLGLTNLAGRPVIAEAFLT